MEKNSGIDGFIVFTLPEGAKATYMLRQQRPLISEVTPSPADVSTLSRTHG